MSMHACEAVVVQDVPTPIHPMSPPTGQSLPTPIHPSVTDIQPEVEVEDGVEQVRHGEHVIQPEPSALPNITTLLPTNRHTQSPSPPPPPIIIDLRRNQPGQLISTMAKDLISAFQELQKDGSNNEKLVYLVRSHYDNSLISLEYCSTLQRSLNNSANDHHPHPPFSHNLFRHDVSRLISDHSMIVNTLNPIYFCFICQQVSAVFFIAAGIICTAVSAIATANANPEWAWAAVAGAAMAAPVASILFGALRNWRQSVPCNSETAVRKHKEIATRMLFAAGCGIEDLKKIQLVASTLESNSKSLSKTVDHAKKVAAVKRSSEKLLQKVKTYNHDFKWVKKKVVGIVTNP
ncbi:hypothetical protein SASPL_139027 [Salvia splendens]|uniref:Uncharacterized protein n=1 Tax=Salvia splendens TaxID=180675 RepID=A0A8X8ZEU0_SALSN|nr:hypothetical protein SASPL_139027 [Salvia splendens]